MNPKKGKWIAIVLVILLSGITQAGLAYAEGMTGAELVCTSLKNNIVIRQGETVKLFVQLTAIGDLSGCTKDQPAVASLDTSYTFGADGIKSTVGSIESQFYNGGANSYFIGISISADANAIPGEYTMEIASNVKNPLSGTDGILNNKIKDYINIKVEALDNEPPVISIIAPAEGASYLIGEQVLADWHASDCLSGIQSEEATVPRGAAVDTSTAGEKTFSITVVDKAGNKLEKTIKYRVHYQYIEMKTKLIKKGGAYPVKFSLKDGQGNNVADASAQLYITKLDGRESTGEQMASSVGKANQGNLFRYDPKDAVYIYNLDTKGLSPGKYKLTVKLDDGSRHISFVEFR